MLILPESISQSLCCRLVRLQKHRDLASSPDPTLSWVGPEDEANRDRDMDSGSMSTLPTLSCFLTFLYNPYMPPS